MSEHAPLFNDGKNQEMIKHHFEISRISDGLAFGHGIISGHDDDPSVLSRVDETIHGSVDMLVPIGKDESGKVLDDDGCGDGREVAAVFSRHKTFKKSLDRPKVFGGSTVMAAASLIGTGEAKDAPLSDVFGEAIVTLQDRDIDFGAHTDEKASADNCGCGAIDRAPEAVFAALKYETPIRKVISSLGADMEELDTVYDNFRAYVGKMPEQAPYSGRQVMDRILDAGKIVKKLGGEHRERRIILNTVRGYTVNQQLIREATEGRAQAFAVDIPRLEDIAQNLFPEEPDKQAQSYLSQLVYTLSIAAVLTKGDLPVYMINDTPAAIAS